MKRVLALLLFLAIAGSSRPAQAQFLTSGNITAAGSGCTTGTGPTTSCIIVTLRQDVASVAFTVSGTFSATLQFKVSQDGVNFTSVNSFPPNSTTPITSTTAVGTWTAGVAGMAAFEIYASAYTSGTATVSISGSRGLSASLLGSGGGGGSGTVNSGAQHTPTVYAGSGTSTVVGPSANCTPPTANGLYQIIFNVTASAALDPSCPQVGLPSRSLAASDTVAYSDVESELFYSSASAGALALPTPTTLGNLKFAVRVTVPSTSTANEVITPATWTINGAASLTLTPGQSYLIRPDPTVANNWAATPSVAGTGIADSTITVVNATFGANGCYSNAATPVLNTASTLTMSGVTTSMVISIAPGADLHTVTGFGSTGGLVVLAWPSAANTVSYYVCNQTASSITTGATALMNVGAR